MKKAKPGVRYEATIYADAKDACGLVCDSLIPKPTPSQKDGDLQIEIEA